MSNNNSRGNFMNVPKNSFLKKHWKKLVLLVFIVIIAVVLRKVLSKKKGIFGPSPRGSTLPELSVSGEKQVASIKTSGYRFRREYELGLLRGDNITFVLTITTKGGFEENDIKQLKIVRKNDLGEIITTLDPPLDIENYSEYTVTFSGSDMSAAAVSADKTANNTFTITGILSDGTEYAIINPMIEETVEIKQEDLNYTLSGVTVTPFTFNMSGTTGLTVSDPTVLRTKYYLTFEPDRAVYLIPGSTPGKFSFKYDDTGGLLTENGVTEFTLDKVGENTYRMYSDDKILTMSGGSFGLLTPNTMTREQAQASLVEISMTPKTPVVSPPPAISSSPTITAPTNLVYTSGNVFPIRVGDSWADPGPKSSGNAIEAESIQGCYDKAPAGSVIAGFRDSTWPDPDYQNTCFYYTKPMKGDALIPTTGHYITCMDQSKSIDNGCGISSNSGNIFPIRPGDSWVDPGPKSSRNAIEAESIQGCYDKAPAGTVIAGFRDTTWTDPDYHNTCFYYSKPMNGDALIPTTGHHMACMDQSKSIDNGCV